MKCDVLLIDGYLGKRRLEAEVAKFHPQRCVFLAFDGAVSSAKLVTRMKRYGRNHSLSPCQDFNLLVPVEKNKSFQGFKRDLKEFSKQHPQLRIF